jgi:hypothetical protein
MKNVSDTWRTEEWRWLHKEELCNVYSYPNIIQVIKSRRMRWSGHVVHMGEVHTGFSCRNLGERDHFEDLDSRIDLPQDRDR